MGILWSLIWYMSIYLAGPYFLLKYILKKNRGDVDRGNEVDVKGKVVIVTGASSGTGKWTAKGLAERGAKVIMACRNIKKAETVKDDIRKMTSNGELIIMEMDLSSLKSVRKFVSDFKSKFDHLDILVNNAGVSYPPGIRRVTKDGFEEQFGVNYLAHFLLTNLLLDELKKNIGSRIVNVGSGAHQWGKINFSDVMYEKGNGDEGILFVSRMYCNSKLANSLFNLELANRLEGSGVHTYGLCPGLVATNIGQEDLTGINKLLKDVFHFLIAKTSEEGAATILHCALSKSVSRHSGEMYRNCEMWDPRRRPKLSEEDAARLWIQSEKMVGLAK